MKTEGQPYLGWQVRDSGEFRHWRVTRPILHRPTVLLAGGALLIVAWLAVILLTDLTNFVIVAPRAQTGFEVFLTAGLLVGSLVLAFIPDQETGGRLQWLAAGMLVFALGAFSFGFSYPLHVLKPDPDTVLYGYLLTRTLGTSLIAVGMALASPPRLRSRVLVLILIGAVALSVAIVPLAPHLPTLVHRIDMQKLEAASTSTVPGTTVWHWAFGAIPFTIALFSTFRAMRFLRRDGPGLWITAAMVALTGAHLHSMFWPPVSSTMLTTSSVLRLTFTLLVLTGGILELRSLLQDRTALLAIEQEHTRRLKELAILKDDFTAMVAHELASPLAAISALAELNALDDATPDQRAGAAAALHDEVRLLSTLITDIQAAIAVEGQEFSCHLQSVPVASLFERAAAFAATLDDSHHPLTVDLAGGATVIADADRIGQVLRNLISNAVKYTPPGTPIHLRAIPQGDEHIRIDVIDWGLGIHPTDQARIFRKYERILHPHASGESGRGLGLYLSQSILRMHRSELTVESAPGLGARFSFLLRKTT